MEKEYKTNRLYGVVGMFHQPKLQNIVNFGGYFEATREKEK